MYMNDNNNEDDEDDNNKKNVVFDAVHFEYNRMASWYDRFWKSYTSATLQLPLKEVKARIIVETSRREEDNGGDGGAIFSGEDSKSIIVVDVGCGTGTFLKQLFDEYTASRDEKTISTSSCGNVSSDGALASVLSPQSLKLYGIEPMEEMLQQATSKFNNVGGGGNNDDNSSPVTVLFERFPAEQLPLKDNSVDIVVSTNAFHFFRNKQQSLCEIQRVLKPSNWNGADNDDGGGALILTDWCNDYVIVKLYHLIERVRWNWIHGFKDAYPSPLSRDELAMLVEAAGLCINMHVTYRVRVFSIFFWGMQSLVAMKRENRRDGTVG